MFAFSLSQIIPLLLCVWRVQFVFRIFFLKKYFTPCFWRVPCVSEFFPKNSYPVLMCLTCLMCFVCLICFSFLPNSMALLTIPLLFERITCHWLNITVYSKPGFCRIYCCWIGKFQRCRAFMPICHVGCKMFFQTKSSLLKPRHAGLNPFLYFLLLHQSLVPKHF